ncbi:MAG: hypothetical protein PVS3B3_01070 [Ktedonobacteraceae bacterium]
MAEETTNTTALYRSIHAQPQAIRELLTEWDIPTQAAQQLNSRERILLAGIGTSYHAALIGEYLFRLAGVDAWAVRSYDFVTYPRPLRSNDGVVVISHRGSKVHGIGAVQRAKQAGIFTVGITGKGSKMRDVNIVLETVEQEVSSAHSISFTGTLIRLAQIAAHLAALRGNTLIVQQIEQGLTIIPTSLEQVFPLENILRQVAHDVVARQRRIFIVGAGPNAAIAPEGALKAKEAAYVTVEGLELEQAIHGPFVGFEANDLIVIVSVKGPSQPRIADFLHALHEIGTSVLLLGTIPTDDINLFTRDGWTHIELATDVIEELTPLLTVVPLQLLADFLASARGVNADIFRADQETYKRASATFHL